MSADFLDAYAYELPQRLIAEAPAEPRDSARLLVHSSRCGDIADSTFAQLAAHIPSGALLVLNETKVVPARIALSKRTGGRAEVLFYINLWDGKSSRLKGISDRKLVIGQPLFIQGLELCSVIGQNEQTFEFELSVTPETFTETLERHGRTPLPPYLRKSRLGESERKESYQTMFARTAGSIAAPTASLHFTPRLFESLCRRGIRISYITLHVGAGTFAPLTEKEIASGALHEESYSIPDQTVKEIRRAKKEGRPVIPVGTTALRAIESAPFEDSTMQSAHGRTTLFIRKPYDFKIADGLITNFHVPRSSLMCLVDAFLEFKGSQRTLMDLYAHAKDRNYRFYSFGDGMLIL